MLPRCFQRGILWVGGLTSSNEWKGERHFQSMIPISIYSEMVQQFTYRRTTRANSTSHSLKNLIFECNNLRPRNSSSHSGPSCQCSNRFTTGHCQMPQNVERPNADHLQVFLLTPCCLVGSHSSTLLVSPDCSSFVRSTSRSRWLNYLISFSAVQQ